MAYVIQQPSAGYPQIGDVIADGGYIDGPPLGTIVTAVDPDLGSGEFIYLSGVASTVLGSVVVYNASDHSTVLADADDIGPVAIAMGPTVADTKGWYQISGKGVAKVLASFADNMDCYLTATDGSIDDAVVTGDYIFRMKSASAIDTPSTGLAYVEMQRPFTTDQAQDATTP